VETQSRERGGVVTEAISGGGTKGCSWFALKEKEREREREREEKERGEVVRKTIFGEGATRNCISGFEGS
jgi:hypothetical protein